MSKEENRRKIERLYELYEQPMYRIAYAILHHVQQAEDAVSDAFVKIIRNLSQIDAADSAETKRFIVQIIRNTAINQYRKNAADAQRFTELDDTAAQIPDENNEVQQRMIHMEQKEAVQEILDGLSTSEREILWLRCEEELSFKEIASRLSLSEAAVRKRFERAKKAAQKQKGESYYGKELFTV
ncbi:MAG: sigma-70 family RNA polymerase sigma factor [Ruminococcus sp.]|nr:sigma-70 family RNA polymerase sigma factor [Ruminococcus sp.]